jgi:predicted component of type VI protein secretion system
MAWAWQHFGPSRWRTVLLPIAAGVLLTLAITACGGGGSSGPPSNPGTPAGTYNLTVTGTAGTAPNTVTHTVPLTLTVT